MDGTFAVDVPQETVGDADYFFSAVFYLTIFASF